MGRNEGKQSKKKLNPWILPLPHAGLGGAVVSALARVLAKGHSRILPGIHILPFAAPPGRNHERPPRRSREDSR